MNGIGLEDLEIREQVNNIQNTVEYWEESSRFEMTNCHSNSSEKPSTYTGVKNSQRRE